MDTLLIIRQNYSSFTTVEKKIADYIFEVGEKMLEKMEHETRRNRETEIEKRENQSENKKKK